MSQEQQQQQTNKVVVILPHEMWSTIYSFLPRRDRSQFERVCLLFRSTCLGEERRSIREMWKLHNQYLLNPLNEEPVPEEKIQALESRLWKIPFHLREFIKLTDGRSDSPPLPRVGLFHQHQHHWSHSLCQFDDWQLLGNGNILRIGSNDNLFSIMIDVKKGTVKVVDIDDIHYEELEHQYECITDWLKGSFVDHNGTFDIEKLSQPSNREDLKRLLKDCGSIFKDLPEILRHDREIFKIAVQSYGPAFGYTSEEIANDRDLVVECCTSNCCEMRFFAEQFKMDKQLILKYSTNFQDCHESLHFDEEVLYHYLAVGAVHSIGQFPKEMISEELIIQAARCGIEYDFTDHFFSNKLVLTLLDYLIPKEYSIFGSVIKQNEYRLDEQVLQKIANVNPIFVLLNLNYSEEVTLTKEMVLHYMKEIATPSTSSFFNLPAKWRRDKDVVRAALLLNFENYSFIDNDNNNNLKEDVEFLLPILEKSPIGIRNVLNELPSCILKNNEPNLRLVLNANPNLLNELAQEQLSEEFINSLNFGYLGCKFSEILTKTRYECYCNNFKMVRRINSHH